VDSRSGEPILTNAEAIENNAKPLGLIVATVGSVIHETRLFLEARLDGYPHVGTLFSNIDPNAWGPGLFEAVGVIGRELRSLANATNLTFEPKYVLVAPVTFGGLQGTRKSGRYFRA
jgi:hypothetical protein